MPTRPPPHDDPRVRRSVFSQAFRHQEGDGTLVLDEAHDEVSVAAVRSIEAAVSSIREATTQALGRVDEAVLRAEASAERLTVLSAGIEDRIAQAVTGLQRSVDAMATGVAQMEERLAAAVQASTAAVQEGSGQAGQAVADLDDAVGVVGNEVRQSAQQVARTTAAVATRVDTAVERLTVATDALAVSVEESTDRAGSATDLLTAAGEASREEAAAARAAADAILGARDELTASLRDLLLQVREAVGQASGQMSDSIARTQDTVAQQSAALDLLIHEAVSVAGGIEQQMAALRGSAEANGTAVMQSTAQLREGSERQVAWLSEQLQVMVDANAERIAAQVADELAAVRMAVNVAAESIQVEGLSATVLAAREAITGEVDRASQQIHATGGHVAATIAAAGLDDAWSAALDEARGEMLRWLIEIREDLRAEIAHGLAGRAQADQV